MSRRIFSFNEPERFIAGTIGEPGGRTFFLQARDGRRVVSIVLEKAQVAVLAERLGALLGERGRRGIELPPAGEVGQAAAPPDEPPGEAVTAGAPTPPRGGASQRRLGRARAA